MESNAFEKSMKVTTHWHSCLTVHSSMAVFKGIVESLQQIEEYPVIHIWSVTSYNNQTVIVRLPICCLMIYMLLLFIQLVAKILHTLAHDMIDTKLPVSSTLHDGKQQTHHMLHSIHKSCYHHHLVYSSLGNNQHFS